MTDRKYLRESAINNVIKEWKNLDLIPLSSQTIQDAIMDTAFRLKLSRRTAQEYVYMARYRQQKARENNAANELPEGQKQGIQNS